jgi:hypothetical protein
MIIQTSCEFGGVLKQIALMVYIDIYWIVFVVLNSYLFLYYILFIVASHHYNPVPFVCFVLSFRCIILPLHFTSSFA